MPYPRSQLNSFEEIAIDLHPHWIYFAQSALGLLGALVVTYFVKFGPGFLDHDSVVLVCVFAILACAVWLGITYVRWVTTNFVVTTDRVIFREGVFARHGVEIPLERVSNVNFRQTIFERLVGAGDLTIESAGRDGESRFHDIRKPHAVQNLIHAQVEQNENRRWDRLGPGQQGSPLPPPAPAPAASAPPPHDVFTSLEKLEELRQRGVLTQAEFDAQKAKLLS